MWTQEVLGPIQKHNIIFPSGNKHYSKPFSTVGGNQNLNHLANPNTWLTSIIVNMIADLDDQFDSDEEQDLEEENLNVQAAAAISIAFAVIDYSQTYYDKTPYGTGCI